MSNRMFQLSPLALALSTLFISQVHAQENDSNEHAMEEVVVTASYSKSLKKAVDLKRENIGFSDSIVASDIADFPEQNLAEALQRMPGVTIERNKGLGQKVNVRSLPSDFTFVSINNLATASGSGGRDVEFDIFASEIIQSVTVKKSPTAADEEGGIAGSVDINTARPFDYNERKIVVSLEGAYNEISEETDPKLALLASDTFGDWGALASFAYSERTNRSDSNSGIDFRPISRWLEKTGSSQFQADQTAEVLERDAGIIINDRFDDDETSRVVFLNKVGDRAYLTEQEKWGATLSLQYKPNSNFSLTLDGLVGNFDDHEDEYDAAAYTASSISSLEKVHAYDNTTLSEYGITVITDADYAATQHELLSKENSNNTDYQQYSLTMDSLLGQWDIYGVIGYSGAQKTSENTNLKHTAYRATRSRYTSTGAETLSSDNAESFDMYNTPEAYLFDYNEVNIEDISDDKYAAQLDFSRQLNLAYLPALSSIQFGARYTDKSKERNYGSNRVTGPTAGDSSWVGTRTLADSQLTSISELVSGGEYLPEVSSKVDWSQVSNSYARNELRYDGFTVDFEPDQFYQVKEKTSAIYAMADFSFHIGKMPATLNAGVRYIDTEVISSGYHQIQGSDGTTSYTSAPISKSGNYTDLLPSINFSLDLSDNLVLRAAASETLIRPALTDIAYKRTVSLSEFKYRDGNPDLQPTYADQWEMGLEWYLEKGGLLAISYFEKEIKGVVRESLTGVVNDVTKYNDNGSIDGVYDFDIYQKVNAEGAYDVSGIELIAQIPFGRFHSTLEGFGVNANYTSLDNSLTGSSDLGIPTPAEGLADETYNVTFYYENLNFDARISYNYKDKYVEYIERDIYPVYRDAYGQTDISLGYNINDTIKMTLEGINITDEATKGYTLDSAFPTMYEFSGRRISLGLRAIF
ncbi:TonB-dependent receptor [Colwellia sp. 1_MG-2023]|uniref:TonB-dependent receptor n=1 Tax=unclassified Colwellia TaxID=196834 RepID=UPI001C095141|nr:MULTISPECIES: TonB-dependent receptor [unclassified Colwellia]MBU2926379.1 TonB-dependent receptor [Colwellia sp. C2M11]MDO6651817.1 TonB-dependent receptor [Colwellia sp. 3_MG-2023]MDO6665272.1 TonB-dependent receptor [Colwellia sp. 2_MG-2023]MDO6689645.1 TonB-dependent receptor [Colwellia sp. 1_MG-2023]